MTEQEYINVSEKKAIEHALNILKDICVPNSVIIKENDFRPMMKLLSKYLDKYYKIMDIDSE